MPDCMKKISYIVACEVFFCANVVFATEPIAGQMLKHEETTPYFDVEPNRNLTDILPSASSQENIEPDIYFVADELTSNDKQKTLEAKGNVEIRRENMTLYTDKLVYYQNTDDIIAIGNVRLVEQSGHTIYADEVNLKDKMSSAEMNKIKVILSDETKIWAEVKVSTYVDGDTTHFIPKGTPSVWVNDEDGILKARYNSCDTPESTGKVEPWGKAASDFTKGQLVNAKTIVIETDLL